MKKKLRNDLILVGAILLFAAIAFLIFLTTGRDGAYVRVTQDGEVIAVYPLNEDIQVKIESADGGYNVLRIEDGYAYVDGADCRDRICVNHRKIKRSGASIVCLPNKLTVTVIGANSAEPDFSV